MFSKYTVSLLKNT